MRIIFFGTSAFAATVLSFLLDQKFSIAAVITRPDAASGRNLQPSPPPVKKIAQEKNSQVPIHQPIKASDPAFAETLKSYQADLFVVVAYGEILKQNILDIPPKGCINIHASLLPKYRGAAPIQRSIMAGDEKTGITIIAMALQMDAGDMLGIEEVEIATEDTFAEVEQKLKNTACKLVAEVIHKIEKGTVTRTPQNHALATFAQKLTPADERINWSQPAKEIHNQIRALSPFPGAWCQIDINGSVKRLKIKKAVLVKGVSEAPGTVVSRDQKKITIACGHDGLALLEVQLEGKKVMDVGSFLRGLSAQQSITLL